MSYARGLVQLVYSGLSRIVSVLLIIAVVNFSNVQKADAKDIMDSIIDVLTGLTCETQGVGDLLRSEFSHTCIPASFFSFMVANILSPGLYANSVLRLKINDQEMFPGACERPNRIDPRLSRDSTDTSKPLDPNTKLKLSFAVCSNTKLAVVRVKAVAKSAIAIASSMFTGKSPWDDIKKSWDFPKEDYHEMFRSTEEGDSGNMIDIGLVPWFPWKVIRENDRLCVATMAFSGWIPVGCKYIKEPYPQSIYASFMDLNQSGSLYSAEDDMALMKCSNTGGCYQRAYNNSRTAVIISGPLIECIREMATRLLASSDVCTFDDINSVVNSSKRETSSFFKFQQNMHKTVTAFLTIYVIFFGFKILLTGNVPPKAEFVNFVVKVIFVTYFSVGINIQPYSNSDYGKLDGMIQWAFPFLLGGMNQMASWIMNASPSELCKFDMSYAKGLEHLALWDALDCRVSHYLGLDFIQTMIVENQARNHDFVNFDFFSFSVPPYYYLLIPAVITGNMTLVSLALMYPLLVISVGAYMVNATVICMISIVILGVLAPLFVPMLLFQYTRGYFDGWVKLMISFMLQPMVVTTFMVTMFSVYDFGFYGSCRYDSKDLKSDQRQTRIFYVSNNWASYDGGEDGDEAKGCKNSLGFMLNNPIAAMYDFGKSSVKEMAKPQSSTDDFMAKFQFLSAITFSPAMFFISPKVLFEKIKDLVLALITACFTLYLMYHFSAQLSEFAADMTEGVSLSAVAIKPQAIFKAGMKALSAAGGAMKGVGGAGKAGAGRAGDKIGGNVGGGEGAGDKIGGNVGGGGGAGDKIGGNVGDGGGSSNSSSGGNGSTNKKVDGETEGGSGVGGSSGAGFQNANRSSGGEIQQQNISVADTGPMRKLETPEVRENLEKFFSDRNIDTNNLTGFSKAEFSRYVAFSSEEKKFAKVKSVYEAMLRNTMNNDKMNGHQEAYAKNIESMFSGTQKAEIAKINASVLSELKPEQKRGGGVVKPQTGQDVKSTKQPTQNSSQDMNSNVNIGGGAMELFGSVQRTEGSIDEKLKQFSNLNDTNNADSVDKKSSSVPEKEVPTRDDTSSTKNTIDRDTTTESKAPKSQENQDREEKEDLNQPKESNINQGEGGDKT
ncbi:TrbL/VirB6 family protein [Candidatus Trichorickettsia mobilis]|nr:type IV secretion system protein [Candidatus Trichorickettsia mobilis]